MNKLIAFARNIVSTSPLAALSWWVACLFASLEAANVEVELMREERVVQWDKRKKAEARLFEIMKQRDAALATWAELEAAGAVMVSSLVGLEKERDTAREERERAYVEQARLRGELRSVRRTLAAVYSTGWQAIVERDELLANDQKLGSWLSATIARAEEAEQVAHGLRAKLDSLMMLSGPSCGACAEELFVGATGRAHECGITDTLTIEALAVEPVAVEPPPCAWCLAPADGGAFIDEVNGGDGGQLPMCCACNYDRTVTSRDIRARHRARIASCPGRRTSPDPLAVECPACRALVGDACLAQRPMHNAVGGDQ